MSALSWLVLPAAYLLGGVSPGYWLVRLRRGVDVRTQGTGVTGATNVGRVLGRGGFIAVLALDAVKGALAVVVARAAGLAGGWEFAAAAAVVAGHVWPVQLGFRGGRGYGPLLGAWLVLAPLAIGACLIIAGLAWAVSRRKLVSGLLGTVLLPIATWVETRSGPAAACAGIVVVVVLLSHRSRLQAETTPSGAA